MTDEQEQNWATITTVDAHCAFADVEGDTIVVSRRAHRLVSEVTGDSKVEGITARDFLRGDNAASQSFYYRYDAPSAKRGGRVPVLCNHTIHKHHNHFGWDNGIEPILTVTPGETVEIETIDASAGQVGPDTTLEQFLARDSSRVNPVTGPIFVEGAEPGDAVAVTFRAFQPSGWGWTANIPGFGLLADQFTEPALHIWKYDAQTLAPALFGPGGAVPLRPFCGTVGLAPAEPGVHSVIPPRRVGGNLDIRDNAVGTTLYLPVEVAGGLLSLGDTHAAQGDGEVCGTAIESPMVVAVEIGLIKQAGISFPRFETSGPVSRHLDEDGYWAATGVGPDLMQAARDAVSGMVDWLCARTNMSAVDAYMLCSVCADLRISEIVDAPNWTVSLYFPKMVLR